MRFEAVLISPLMTTTVQVRPRSSYETDIELVDQVDRARGEIHDDKRDKSIGEKSRQAETRSVDPSLHDRELSQVQAARPHLPSRVTSFSSPRRSCKVDLLETMSRR